LLNGINLSYIIRYEKTIILIELSKSKPRAYGMISHESNFY